MLFFCPVPQNQISPTPHKSASCAAAHKHCLMAGYMKFETYQLSRVGVYLTQTDRQANKSPRTRLYKFHYLNRHSCNRTGALVSTHPTYRTPSRHHFIILETFYLKTYRTPSRHHFIILETFYLKNLKTHNTNVCTQYCMN